MMHTRSNEYSAVPGISRPTVRSPARRGRGSPGWIPALAALTLLVSGNVAAVTTVPASIPAFAAQADFDAARPAGLSSYSPNLSTGPWATLAGSMFATASSVTDRGVTYTGPKPGTTIGSNGTELFAIDPAVGGFFHPTPDGFQLKTDGTFRLMAFSGTFTGSQSVQLDLIVDAGTPNERVGNFNVANPAAGPLGAFMGVVDDTTQGFDTLTVIVRDPLSTKTFRTGNIVLYTDSAFPAPAAPAGVVPLPAALPLLGSGLVWLGFGAWRRQSRR